MSLDINNPWLVGIFGGVVAGIITGIVLYYLFGRREQRRSISIIKSSVNNADELLKKNMDKEALDLYIEILNKVSKKREPERYSYIKNKEGICYGKLANISNKEDNLNKEIQAYEEALKIYTVEKYPNDYKMTISNIDLAKKTLGK